jgi:xanthine dehydrogenase accessory factor
VSALVPSDPPVTELDPVCGMAVEVAIARHYVAFEGRTFYFCCPRCKAAFERDPEKYTVVVG